MDLKEYNIVKNYSYLNYCDYLQIKYGIGLTDYFTPNWSRKNGKYGPSRTKEGLFCHHKFEDHAIMLSEKEFAQKNPFEWQKKENLVYCDLLEHLLLHILICKFPAERKNSEEKVGIGGVVNHLIPKLNDLFLGSGYNYLRERGRLKDWEIKCIERLVGTGNWNPRDDRGRDTGANPLWTEKKKIFEDMKDVTRVLLQENGYKNREIEDFLRNHKIDVIRLIMEEEHD